MTRNLFACGTDNDGFPTCQGDGSACARDERGEYCDRLPVTVLQCHIEGTQSAVLVVGVTLTAGPETPDEAKAVMVRMGMKALAHQYPGTTDIQVVKDWHEAQIEAPDGEGTD